MALKRAVGFFEENLSHALKISKFTSEPQIKHKKIKISHSFIHTKKKSKTYRNQINQLYDLQVYDLLEQWVEIVPKTSHTKLQTHQAPRTKYQRNVQIIS